MPTLPFILMPIGTAVTKFLIKSVIGDGIVNTVSGGIVDIFAKKLASPSESKKTEEMFEKVGEEVARSLEPLFNNSRDVNQEAVALAVQETLEKLPGTSALIEAKLDDDRLHAMLKNVRQLPRGQFGEGETALYYSTIAVLAPRLNQIASKLKDFERVFSQAVLGELDEILRAVQEESSAVKFARYEKLYLRAIRDKLDYMELFGAGIEPGRDRQKLLSIAYVSLNLRQGEGEKEQNMDARRLFESLHKESAKVLIVGEAGSGKSTLMRWIAMEVANWQFGLRREQPGIYLNDAKDERYADASKPKEEQNVWQKRVPFLIRLRTLDKQGYTLPNLDLIPLCEAPMIGNPPEGYMQWVIDNGRALFLVDGIDEVPDDKRGDLRESLEGYFGIGGNCFVLTSRPAAVDNLTTWRQQQHVELAHVNSLSFAEARQLVYTWHKAVRLNIERSHASEEEKGEQFARLEGIEEALLAKVETRESLSSLMGNPLLCSMICALHWWKNRELPKNLIDVCEDLCKVLLEERSALAGVKEKDFVACYARLDYSLKRQMVQDIAVAMVTPEWRSEIPGLEAKEIIAKELDAVDGHNGDDAETVLKKMIERSGMLRERSGIIQQLDQSRLEFIHNTFKEFLTAEYLVDENQEALLDNIGNPDWENVLLFAAGNQARRHREVGKQIVQGLLETGDKGRRLFALRCRAVLRATAAELDEQLERLCQEYFPPNNEEEAIAVSAIGNDAVPELGYRNNLSDEQAKACVVALGRINSAAARNIAEEYANDERVFDELVRVINPLMIPKVLNWIDQGKNFEVEDFVWRKQVSDLTPLRELANLRSLDISNMQVSDLTLLQELTNLQTLDFSGTPVNDLTPLQGLTNLQSLHFFVTQVSDLTPLQDLTNLQSIDCFHTQVSDLKPLQGLTNLQSIDCSFTQVSDLTPLQGLTNLQSITSADTMIDDLQPINGLSSLQTINLADTQVSDLTPLQELTNLQTLNLFGTQVSDLTPLQKVASLQTLSVSHTQISDLTPLQELTNLQTLNLSSTQVSDLTPLQKVASLQTLSVSHTQISDLTPLQGLTNLQSLEFVNTRIDDLTQLQGLSNLKNLNLAFTQVNTLAPIQESFNLETLTFFGTQIDDLTPIRRLTQLLHLDFSGTKVNDLSILQELPNLLTLDLRETNISDLSPLQELPQLQRLHLNKEREGSYSGVTEALEAIIKWM